MSSPVRSFARSNLKLREYFENYLLARGNSLETRCHYLFGIDRLIESVGSKNILDLDRYDIRVLFTDWRRRGLAPTSVVLYTHALRSFFRFAIQAGVTKHNPMFIIKNRKIPIRLPIVLSVEQVEKLIGAGENPFECAVVEVLYSTGVRVSELTQLRLADVNWKSRTIRVHKGKGGKDRVVLFGRFAKRALRRYLRWRPSQAGFLFEAPTRTGVLIRGNRWWVGLFYGNKVQRRLKVARVSEVPDELEARRKLDELLAKLPGFCPVPQRPYCHGAIRDLLNRLASRAGVGRVHPHALRRAMASHMLRRGGNLRVIQDLLGHEKLNTTMRYTHLDADHIKAVHKKFHPHEVKNAKG